MYILPLKGARAGQRAGAGKGHDGGHRKAGRTLEKVVHGISLHMTICHFLFEPILKFLRSFQKVLRSLYDRFLLFSTFFPIFIHERNISLSRP